MYAGKRLFDVGFSLLALLVASPLFVLIGLLVAGSSPGPVFYLQNRLGYRHRVFKILKFRTMYVDTETKFDLVTRGDRRVTKIGRILRRTHLDELPQFLNVLLGHMSVVGPRPDEIGIARKLRRKIPGYRETFYEMMPGITGPSQVFGREVINECIGREGEQELIQAYRVAAKRYGFLSGVWSDIKILYRTVGCVGTANGV